MKELQKKVIGTLLSKGIFVSKEDMDLIKSLNEDKLNFINIQVTRGAKDINKLLNLNANVEVVKSYNKEISKKKEVSDFVNYFKKRLHSIGEILKSRPELKNSLSINRILNKKDSEKISLIGIVFDVQESKNGHIILTLEDTTGKIRVIVSKNKPFFEEIKDVVFDEVIGLVGTNKEDVIFADKIIWPDIPLQNELKKSPDETYAAFISDVHVGSKVFLEKKFSKFIRWLNGEEGTEEHKKIIKKIKYLFITGDLIAGVGIYPKQEEDLVIKSVYDQYDKFTEYIKKIPKEINIIICPGNHDAGRLAEPQLPVSKEMAPKLHELPNVTLVSNPSLIKIHKLPGFPGFNVLMYHGYSFNYYINNVDSIRNGGGYHRADLVMKFLLKRRHVCPTHTSTPYFPDHLEDPLVIKEVPDFFVSGDIHYCAVADYNNVTMICSSCWEDATDFQIKLGHDPEPARVPLVNLQTRKVKVLKF